MTRRHGFSIGLVVMLVVATILNNLGAVGAAAESPLVWHRLVDSPTDTNSTHNKRYLDVVYEFMLIVEGPRPSIYTDTAPTPQATIGIGYNLSGNPHARVKVMEAFGVKPHASATDKQKATVQTTVAAINTAIDLFNKPLAQHGF